MRLAEFLRARAAFASAIVYTLLTLVIGRSIVAAVTTRIASDAGDPVLNAAILQWNATHLPWSDDWFQFPIFYPTRDALAFSEHLLGVSVLATPIYWLTGSAVAAYNISLLLTYPLCGLAMFALVRRLTGSAAAAFLAGLAYGFAPFRASHLPQIQVLTSFWAPLALLGLHEFLRGGRRSWLPLFAVCWALQGASNGYLLVHFSLLIGLWMLWFLVARYRWRDVALIAGSMALGALPLVPILYRYLTVHHAQGLTRNIGEISAFGADIGSVLCAPAALTVWGRLRVACTAEGELFPGFGLVVICLAGWLILTRTSPSNNSATIDEAYATAPVFFHPLTRALRHLAVAVSVLYLGIAASVVIAGPWRFDIGPVRASVSSPAKPFSMALGMVALATLLSGRFGRTVRRGSTATFYLVAALVCWVLSWGPFPRLFGTAVLYQAPYAWLLQLPGVDGLRVPARFWMMSVLCLSICLGILVSRLLHGKSALRGALMVTVLTAALIADGFLTIPAAQITVIAPPALTNQTVLSLPVGMPGRDVATVNEAVNGGWRAVNGFSGYEPGYYEALRTLSAVHDSALFEPFRPLTNLYVVVQAGDAEAQRLLQDQPGSELQLENEGQRLYFLPRRVGGTAPSSLGRRLPARAVNASCAAEEIARATDGDVGTEWVCGPQTKGNEITVDLGRPAPAGGLVHALGERASAFPRHLVVETSLDRKTWRLVWEGSPAAAVLRAAMASPRETRAVVQFTPQPARYLRLRQTGRHPLNYWSIAELEVWSGE